MAISTIGTNALSSTAQIGSLTTASGSAPSYSARAWVNFNGNGTVAIRASGNVTSITDNGVGDYTVNFTTAMSDANYCVEITQGHDASGGNWLAAPIVNWGTGAVYQAPTTSAFRFININYNLSAYSDIGQGNVAIFR